MPFSEADSLAELGVSAGASADVERSVLRKQLSKAAMGVATDLSSAQLQAAARALADVIRKERTAANKPGERCTPSYLDVQQGRAVLLQRLADWVASEEATPGSPFAPASLQHAGLAHSSAPPAPFSNILSAPSAIRQGLATPGELLAASSGPSAAPSAASSSQAVATGGSHLNSIAQQVLGTVGQRGGEGRSRRSASSAPRAGSAAPAPSVSAAPGSPDVHSVSSSSSVASPAEPVAAASSSALCPACGANLGIDTATAEGLQRMNAHLDRCVSGTSRRQAGAKRRRPGPAAVAATGSSDSDSSLFSPEPTPRARASHGHRQRSPGSASRQSTPSRAPPPKSPRARLQGAGHMILDDTDPGLFEQRVADWYGEQFTVEEEHAAVGPVHDGTSKPLRSSMRSDDTQFRLGAALPTALVSKLFGYQRTGLRWLLELHAANTGGVLADEMGLGKTVQIVSLLGALHHAGVSYGPHLVVVPLTVLGHWVREFHAWYPALRVVVMHDSSRAAKVDGLAYNDMLDFALSKQRCTVRIPRRRFVQGQCVQDTAVCPAATRRIQLGAESTVVITTYHALRTRISELASMPWGYVVLDEAARIRNPAAAVTLAAKRLQSPHRIAMSGSPLQNSLSELWSLFDFVQPGKLGTQAAFELQFGRPIAAGGWANASPVQSAKAVQCAMVLRDAIRPFLLRRLKLDVQASLPPKTEQVLFCGMTPRQLGLYRAFLQGDEVEAVLRGEALAFRVIGMLQKLCNHPALFEDTPPLPPKSRMRGGQLQYRAAQFTADRASKSDRMLRGARAWHQSGKLAVAIRVLRTWADAGHKTLLFCQGTSMLDMFEGWLHTQPDMRYLRMDGTTSSHVRQSLIDQFNSDGSVRVFLLTTRVGGIGVNLTGANRVLLFDPAWNPSVDAQARERAWRVGQAKPVTVYRLVTAGTVEERVYERQLWKTLLAQRVLGNPNAAQSVDSSQLRQLLALDERKVVVRDTQADVKALAERGALKVRTQDYRSESDSSAQGTSDSECEAGPPASAARRGPHAPAEATDSAVLDAMFNDGDLAHAVEKTAPSSAHRAAVPRSQRQAVQAAARAAAQVAQASLAQTGDAQRIMAAQQAARLDGQQPARTQRLPTQRAPRRGGARTLRIPTSLVSVAQPTWQDEAARGTTLGLHLRGRLSAAIPLPQVLGIDGQARTAVSCHFLLTHQRTSSAAFQVLPLPLYTAQGSLQHLRGLGAPRSTAAPRRHLALRAGNVPQASGQRAEAGYFAAAGPSGLSSLAGADVLASLRSLGMTQGLPAAAQPGHARREAAAAADIVAEAAELEDRHGRTFRSAAAPVVHALQARAAGQAGPFLERMQVAMDTAGGSMSTEEVVSAFGSSMPARALKRALRKHCEQQPRTGRWQLLPQYQAM